MVIDDISEVVGGKSIRFQKDLIVDIGPRKGDPSFNPIFVNAFAGERNFETDDIGLTCLFAFCDFFRGLSCGIFGHSLTLALI